MTGEQQREVALQFHLGKMDEFNANGRADRCQIDRDLGQFSAFDYRTMPIYNASGEGPYRRDKRTDAKDIKVYRLQNVFVGRRGVIFTEDGLIFAQHTAPFLEDIYQNPGRHAYVMAPYGFTWKGGRKCFERNFSIPENARSIEEPVFLTSSYWEQAYTHFLIEVLPSLSIHNAHYKKTKLLLSADVALARRDILNLIGIPTQEIETKAIDEIVFVKELIVADFPRFAAPETADFLETAIGRNFQHFGRAEYAGKPIYLARHDEFAWDRFILNEPQVISMLESRGFEIVIPSKLNFSEQIEIFMRAPVIITQYGGAMFNLLLGLENKNIVILSSEDYLRFHFDSMNQFLGHNAVRLLCGSFTSRRDPNNSPIIVNIETLASIIDKFKY
jgi:capsular polysaccharide biosynthesis protein